MRTTGAGSSARVDRIRCGRAALFAVPLLSAIVLLSSGCGGEKTLAGPSRDGAGGQALTLTVDALPADLHLSQEQRGEMSSVLANLDRARKERRAFWEQHRDRQGSGPARRQGRNRWHGGPGAGGPGAGAPAGADSLWKQPPPIFGFLEESSRILDTRQFTLLTRFLADRMEQAGGRAHAGGPDGFRGPRMGRGPGHGGPDSSATGRHFPKEWADRMAARRQEMMQARTEQRTAFLTRVLALSPRQSAQVGQVATQSSAERQAIFEQIRSGAIGPEEARTRNQEIARRAAEQIRAVLTPDQAARFDALSVLLPERFRGHFGPD